MKKTIILVFAIGLILTACGTKTPNVQPVPNNNAVKGDTTPKQIEVTLYFPSIEADRTGNDKLPSVLPEKRLISPADNLELTVVKELFKGPTDTQKLSKLPKQAKLLGVKVEGDTAYVDLLSEGLSGSSTEEGNIIDPIVMTLTEIKSINKVQFTVDGKITESLMGQFDTSKPFTRPKQ